MTRPLLTEALDKGPLVALTGGRPCLAPAAVTDELRELLAREDEQIRSALDAALRAGAEDICGLVWDSQRLADQQALSRLVGSPGLVAAAPRDEVRALVQALRPKASATLTALSKRPGPGFYLLVLVATEGAVVITIAPGKRWAPS